MKRVLIIDRFFFPDEQATSVYLTELVQNLKEKFKIEILCGPPLVVTESGPPLSETIQVTQVSCPKFPKRILAARALNDFGFLCSALLKGIFRQKPDLVVSQTSPPGIWLVGLFLSLRFGVPWIHVSKDVFPDNARALQPRLSFLINCVDWVTTCILKCAEKIVVIGQDMRSHFLRKGISARKISVIRDWVDADFVRPMEKNNAYARSQGISDRFVILYAGNFGRIHNLEDILAAAERLKEYPEIVFQLVGEGALKHWLFEEIQKRNLSNVRIASFEPRSRLPEVLAAADVSLILLRKGMAGLSMPSKFYSILASGRPVLACVDEESDLALMVMEAKCGFVVFPGDTDRFVESIQHLYQDKALRTSFGMNARHYIEEKDFQKTAFKDYERLFLEAMTNQAIRSAKS